MQAQEKSSWWWVLAETKRIREESTVPRNVTFKHDTDKVNWIKWYLVIENYRSDYKIRELLSPPIFSYILLVKNFS